MGVHRNTVGRYELAPEVYISVYKFKDRLFGSVTGSGGGEMFPESETQFFVKTANVQVEFVKDTSGTVTHLMMHEPKSISRANKIE